MDRNTAEFYSGCLLGGAIGDSMGAPVEFLSLDTIKRQYSPTGITDLLPSFGKIGSVTDDTQMTLFTAEGLLRSQSRAMQTGIANYIDTVHFAYLRWLHTQEENSENPSFNFAIKPENNGWLIGIKDLYARRAPGNTCIAALENREAGTIKKPINSSKGCGAVMRTAPVGLFFHEPDVAFRVGCDLAAITHGHPNGYLSAGFLSSIISNLVNGANLQQALKSSLDILKTWKNHEQCYEIINHAILLATLRPPAAIELQKLGNGWLGEEALAIGIYCSLCYENNFYKGIILSVNHSGDSDSIGSITGNILGLYLGKSGIPSKWIEIIELRQEIEQISNDLITIYQDNEYWRRKYPGN